MGLFSWLFGGPKAPELDWSRSQKGNLTVQVGGDWITVFKGSRGWRFSAPYPKEAKSDDPYFSPSFHTEEQAKACAEAYIADVRWPFDPK